MSSVLGAQTSKAKPKRVAVLVYESVELLDFAGPAEAFSIAEDENGTKLFDVSIISVDGKKLTSQGFLSINPNYSIKSAPKPDILVIPGGDINNVLANSALRNRIDSWAGKTTHIFSVCNGASLLGSLGHLRNVTVATHRSNFEILRAIDPSLRVSSDAKVVSFDKLTTAAGISSGIDGALLLIAREHGLKVAQRAAIDMEYLYWPGLQAKQISDFTTESNGALVQKGGERQLSQDWKVYRLLTALSDQRPRSEMLALHQRFLAEARGHDLEMIQPQSLEDVSLWLYEIGRDKNVALRLAQVNVDSNPARVEARFTLAKLLSKLGHLSEAARELQWCRRQNPNLSGLHAAELFVAKQIRSHQNKRETK